ncbi:hypothetical protein [Nitrospira moscoviensis]|uniref:Uncharacterized protein n=1 Tax=Nitrospira moscoviensis TaxID=42253 RepID=A0A0K2GBH2_NITMO|nr:hypothetical protein [Nitrospira moscoviensis]ALA58298.1 conserved exported protein of unknown function [Nitrospira moscoviensis]
MRIPAGWAGVMCAALLAIWPAGPAAAEPPAPSVHWGALAYPDQVNTLSIGYTGNRFTQFNGERDQFNRISETMGFNFGSVSWTQHWRCLDGLSTNLTIGAGPTGEQPTRYLQNEFVHDAVYGIPKVPVGRTRDEFDVMASASATYWLPVPSVPRVFFLGGGFSHGSLYTEGFARAGFRRLPIGCALAGRPSCEASEAGDWWLGQLVKGFRLSAMGRFGGIRSAAAFPEGTVSSQSYLGQASLSWGVYDPEGGEPFFEVEGGVTIDSGLFTSARGSTLEQRFWSLGFRVRNFSFETWNDQLNRQDFGPTYGLRVTYNLYPHLFAGR